MNYHITLFSTALFSTWISVEELNILVDAGDGVSMGLLQKSGKIRNVFVTHADRDHLTGLPQLLQLNSRGGYPVVHYPADSGSFPALRNFLQKFDPHVAFAEWRGISTDTEIAIKKDIIVGALRNEHVACAPGLNKSLSYKVYQAKKKLKAEFAGSTEKEIKHLVSMHGRDFLTEEIRTNILSFSGDTPVDDYSKWDGSEVLFHEATFLKKEGDAKKEAGKNKHSLAEEVIRMVSEIQVGKLVLHHFSSRYSREEIKGTVCRLLKEYRLKVPVYVVYPGEIKRDVLNSEPLNS